MRIRPYSTGLFSEQSLAAYLKKYPAPESSREIKYEQKTGLFRLKEAPAKCAVYSLPVGITEEAMAAESSKPGGTRASAGGSVKRTTRKSIVSEKADFGRNTQLCRQCKRVSPGRRLCFLCDPA